MSEIIEFFRGLFDYNRWPPRWHCGYWSTFHGSIYIISDLLVWAAYFLIPLIIFDYLRKKKTSVRYHGVYILFATFILLCGSTHFIDAMMFWIPMYRFNAIVRLATGIVSMFTVYQLYRVLPTILGQKTTIELETEIKRREEAERKLAEANQGLQAFAYVVSHDLQEPLRKMQTFSTLLYNENKEKYDSKSIQYSEKVISSTEKMKVLIKDILALSTISEDVSLACVDTNVAVQEAIDNLEIRIGEKKAIINVAPLPMVLGNTAYLTQLFFNLIGNAIKFNDKQPVITITGNTVGDQVHISVADNGIGIKEEDQQKIFEPFSRLHNKSAYEGTGIGLAIVKKIIHVHEGTIGVQSSPEEGTTFTIVLKAAGEGSS